MMKKLMLIVFVFVMMTPLAAGKQIGKVTLPDSLIVGKDKLLLNGAAFRVKFFMKMYVGGLYLKQKENEPQKIIDADESMSIKLHIVSNMITAKKMKDSIDEGFKNSIGDETASFRDEIDKFTSFFSEEIKKNDIFDITYEPKEGIHVYKNGKWEGTIEGFDFKKAVYGIWLGEKPADTKLKKGMLDK